MKRRKVIELVQEMLKDVEAAVIINGNVTSCGAKATIESHSDGTFHINGNIIANSELPTVEVKNGE